MIRYYKEYADQQDSMRSLPPIFLAPAMRHQFSTTSRLAATRPKKTPSRGHIYDIYAKRQADLRKEAHQRRKTLLREEEAKELGDPIRGKSTAFVESFEYGLSQDAGSQVDQSSMTVGTTPKDQPPPSPANAAFETYMDHGLDKQHLAESLQRSRMMTEPLAMVDLPGASQGRDVAEQSDPEDSDVHKEWRAKDLAATEAVQRITSLGNASSKHWTKKNVERIIETFGRHITDTTLKPRIPTTTDSDASTLMTTPRAGRDTGSSEVQIGILTAKIKVLADAFQGKNRRDKMNKRNLRLLLHRRQKLLKYMERKERGSERWQHMIDTLGLTPATWRGEIEVR